MLLIRPPWKLSFVDSLADQKSKINCPCGDERQLGEPARVRRAPVLADAVGKVSHKAHSTAGESAHRSPGSRFRLRNSRRAAAHRWPASGCDDLDPPGIESIREELPVDVRGWIGIGAGTSCRTTGRRWSRSRASMGLWRTRLYSRSRQEVPLPWKRAALDGGSRLLLWRRSRCRKARERRCDLRPGLRRRELLHHHPRRQDSL